jgi:HEPN domain-containing protein
MSEKHLYWLQSATHDLEVAESLFNSGKYDWCLFIAHLVLEKTFKAYYAFIMNEFPPRTHDLVRLAKSVKIDFEEDTLEFLDSVNTFNISSRYPDEKFNFYKMCTKEFTENNFQKIKEIQKWILIKMNT